MVTEVWPSCSGTAAAICMREASRLCDLGEVTLPHWAYYLQVVLYNLHVTESHPVCLSQVPYSPLSTSQASRTSSHCLRHDNIQALVRPLQRCPAMLLWPAGSPAMYSRPPTQCFSSAPHSGPGPCPGFSPKTSGSPAAFRSPKTRGTDACRPLPSLQPRGH